MKLPARPRRRSSILLVSLVDVLFVLLLFFLLASRSVQIAPDVAVDLRKVAASAAPEVLQLEADGRLLWRGQQLEATAAVQKLGGAPEVRLRAAPGVTLRSLMPVLGTLHAAGIAAVLEAS